MLLAVVPATAFADGAGDEQYQDPLAAPTAPKKVKKQTAAAPVTTAPAATSAPATTAAPTPTSSAAPPARGGAGPPRPPSCPHPQNRRATPRRFARPAAAHRRACRPDRARR